MLTIIIGVILVIVCFCISASSDGDGEEGMLIVGFLLLAVALVLGLVCPISGYNDEWEMVKKTELVPLSDSANSEIVYVINKEDDEYAYRYEIPSEFNTNTSHTYETKTLEGKDVEKIEDPNCENPALYVYKKTGKKSIWTYAINISKTKYVFYVPEGTILEEIK